jgi:hypothetical protein
MKRCPHGWVVVLPDYPCPVSACPANVAAAKPTPPEEKQRAHSIRWRAQHEFDEPWSDWHVFVRVDGNVRGTRCGKSVDLGPYSVERAAIAFGAAPGKCAECFA